MKKSIIFILLAHVISFNLNAQIWTSLVNVKAAFKIKNAGISVDGKFTEVAATATVDEKVFQNSTFSGVIQAKSINTDNSMRDKHLKNKSEFFNVAKYPTITMKAVKVGANQVGGSYKVDWNVTMKGITKKITTDVLVKVDGNSMFLLTVFKINRRDWNVGSKGILMSDDVLVTLSANLLK
jgi:polyisoprenoid-binding protein YceI